MQWLLSFPTGVGRFLPKCVLGIVFPVPGSWSIHILMRSLEFMLQQGSLCVTIPLPRWILITSIFSTHFHQHTWETQLRGVEQSHGLIPNYLFHHLLWFLVLWHPFVELSHAQGLTSGATWKILGMPGTQRFANSNGFDLGCPVASLSQVYTPRTGHAVVNEVGSVAKPCSYLRIWFHFCMLQRLQRWFHSPNST